MKIISSLLLLFTMLITGPFAHDVIISLRHRASRLAWPTRQLISQLGCGPKYVSPRGCRAGQHVQQRRLQARNQATTNCDWVGACEAELKLKPIPVIVGKRATAGVRRTLRPRVIVDVIHSSVASPHTNQSTLLMSPTSSVCSSPADDNDTTTQVTLPASPPSIDQSFLSAASSSDLHCTVDSFDDSISDIADYARPIQTVVGNRHCLSNIRQRRPNRTLSAVTFIPSFIPNILNVNICGGFCAKLDELSLIIEQHSIGIACITETWLKPSVSDDVTQIDKYVCHRRDRQDGRDGGGVFVCVRNNIQCTRLHSYESNDLEVMWLLCRETRMPRCLSHILIGAVYHPPNANHHIMLTYIIDCLDQLSKDHPNLGIILLGDFNRLPDATLKSFPLRQVVKASTRGSAILDKIFTNMFDWYSNPITLAAVGKSDHFPVLMNASDNHCRSGGSDVVVYRRLCDNNRKTLLAHAFRHFNWSTLYRMESCDEMLAYFYEVATVLMDYYLPKCPFKRHTSDKPWVTDKFRQLIRRRQHAYQTRDVTNYRRLRNTVQRLARQLRSQYYTRNVKQLRSSDPHKWWQNVKRFLGNNSSSSHHPLSALANSDFSGDFQRLAADINDEFANVSSDLTPLSHSILQQLHEDDYAADFVIEPFEVYQKLIRINVHKSPGPDAIPNWILKDLAPFVAEPICAIFNASVREGHVPLPWKQANVVPVPKIKVPKIYIQIYDQFLLRLH